MEGIFSIFDLRVDTFIYQQSVLLKKIIRMSVFDGFLQYMCIKLCDFIVFQGIYQGLIQGLIPDK